MGFNRYTSLFIEKEENQKFSIEEVKKFIDTNTIPKDYFVHGAMGHKKGSLGDYTIQMTKDWDIAFQYGSGGYVWLIKPNYSKWENISKFLSEIQEKAWEHYLEGDFIDTYVYDDILKYEDEEDYEEIFKDKIKEIFYPNDIVSSAGAYDNMDYVNWLDDWFPRVDGIYSSDWAVALSSESSMEKNRYSTEIIANLS